MGCDVVGADICFQYTTVPVVAVTRLLDLFVGCTAVEW
jgi:hypothetical protein